MRSIAIRLLGSFEVVINGAVVTGFKYAKVRALLAYLAVGASRAHPRSELAALLWPEQPERAAHASLSQALTTLRNALDDKAAESPVLLSDTHTVQLDARSVTIDSSQLLAMLSTAESHGHHTWRTCAVCAERLQAALAFYRGSFLADVSVADSAEFEQWASLQREHLAQRALTILERLVERAQWCGAYREALVYAQRLVALEPLLEANQRAVMRLLALNGETAAALAQYRQTQTMLADELDLEPEPATSALFERIRRGDLVGLQPASPPFGVTQPPTALVGRRAELQEICTRLRDTKQRALTITGAGGIGKTRMALEAAHALRYDFEDGVVFIELAALGDATLLADTLARALGVHQRPRQPIETALGDYLHAKHLLLILDNFEHIVAGAQLVAELLVACAGLTVLVTSRAPLAIRAEQQFHLEPLADDDAVQLFVKRAEAVGARLVADDASLYSAICQRIDRLPLAIELIAVRARTLTPAELLQQLDRPLQALARGPRDVAARHRSLSNTIQWSYDLLDEQERRVFRRLGLFAGGCTAEAMQAVIGDVAAALPLLEALNQASLLRQLVVGDQTRFLTLQTIREFAAEQLRRDDEAAASERLHAEYYARFAMTAYVELLRADASRWRAWISADIDNLRAAFRWAIDHDEHEIALRLATGVWRFFHWMEGYLREGLDWLEIALEFRNDVPLELQIDALRAAGTLASALNDYARARYWFEAAVEAGWRLGDKDSLQRILTNLGYSLLEQGELDDARVHLEVSLSLAERGTDPKAMKFPLGILARLHLRLGEYETAQALCEQGLRLNREYHDTEGTANALRCLAQIVSARGDPTRAQQLGEEALALHRTLEHQLGIGFDVATLGDIAWRQGNATLAVTHYQQCLSLWRDRESPVISAMVLDSTARALTHLSEAQRGATLLSAAATIREQAQATLTAREQAENDATLLACRESLGTAAFAAACAAGRTLPLAQAIDLALLPLRSRASLKSQQVVGGEVR